MAEHHSKARLKRKDGQKVTITFRDLLKVNGDSQFKDTLHELGITLGDLGRYRAAIATQMEELASLWDDTHTKPIRDEMAKCAEEIEEAIAYFEAVQYDLTLLIGAAEGVSNWLAMNPEYNSVWSYDSNTYYYCKKTSKSRAHHGTRLTGDSMTLEFG